MCGELVVGVGVALVWKGELVGGSSKWEQREGCCFLGNGVGNGDGAVELVFGR